MTHLTYTIAHIIVGAEKPYEEVEGFVNNKLDLLQISNPKYSLLANTQDDDFGTKLRKELNQIGHSNMGDLIDMLEDYICTDIAHIYLKSNPNHPLSKLAKKLGAVVYGGFEDERDFHLVLPTVEGLKVGDCLKIDDLDSLTTYVCYGDIFEMTSYTDYPNTEMQYFGFGDKTKESLDIGFWIEESSNYGNIFQEYARTGIIENDLYKQFFK